MRMARRRHTVKPGTITLCPRALGRAKKAVSACGHRLLRLLALAFLVEYSLSTCPATPTPGVGTPGPAGRAAAALSEPSPAPQATTVYSSDFAKGAGPGWWPRWTSSTPAGGRPFLGEFGIEPVTFILRGLPAHKFVRLTLNLFMLRAVDGTSPIWGPDPWELRVAGGPRLLYTTFDNCGFFNDNNEQAFPDDYPWAVHRGWTGAAEKQTLGYPHSWHGGTVVEDVSSVYRLTLVFPHEDKDLRLSLKALWSEAVKEGGESWGLERMKVETLDGPQKLAPEDLEDLWRDLDSDDATRAFSALWALAGSGDQAVALIRGKMIQPKAKEPAIEEEWARLLKDLDDERFEVREKATARLREIGLPILPKLEKLANTVESPEVRMRLRDVVAQLAIKAAEVKTPKKPPRPQWRSPRAVRVLETVGSLPSLDLLDQLSKQADSPASAYAAAARQRLAERLMDNMLSRADDPGRTGDLPGAEALCNQAHAFAQTWLPEDVRRVASVREDCRLRQEARDAADVPADAAARAEAMRRRLAVADDVAGAARLADDPQARDALALAGRPVENLSADEVQRLHAFYLTQAEASSGRVRAHLITRAMAVARPANQPTTKPFEPSAGVARALLADWVADQAGRGRWTDLLPLMSDMPLNQKDNATPHNEWWRNWSGVKGGGLPPVLLLPVRPVGSYQLRLTFVPVSLKRLSVLVPVGDRYARVAVYEGEGDAAIEASPSVSKSAKWSPSELVTVGEYQADVTVRQEAEGAVVIRLAVDGLTLTEWRGRASDIEKGPEGMPSTPGCPVVSFEGGWVLLRSAAMRMLDGKLAPGVVDQRN